MNGSSLYGIPDPSAGSMSLNKTAQVWVEASIAIDLAHEVLFVLGLGVSFSPESNQVSWLCLLTDLALIHLA